MPHVVELAKTSRSKCRGCRNGIEKGTVRVGVAVPNAFGSGEQLQFFHAICAAERRSEATQELFAGESELFDPEEATLLRELCALGALHPRWTRVTSLERDPSGRAKCRHCREPIDKGGLRLTLEFAEEGMVNAAGFLHPRCAAEYLGSTARLAERLERANVAAELLDELRAEAPEF